MKFNRRKPRRSQPRVCQEVYDDDDDTEPPLYENETHLLRLDKFVLTDYDIQFFCLHTKVLSNEFEFHDRRLPVNCATF